MRFYAKEVNLQKFQIMIKKNKLIEARNNRGYSQEAMAACIGKNVSSYYRKENGEIKISHQEWQILAKELDVPLEDIYESDESMIFVFNDNASGIGNGIGNTITNYTIPQSVWETQKKYIEKLEEETQRLKEEIHLLKNVNST